MKNFLTAIFILGGVVASRGQANNDVAAVSNVISRLFKGMEKSDTATMRSLFDKSATMATVFRNKNNEVVLKREASADGFLKAIGSPRKQVLYEEIWDVKVQIDGDFAQAWCDYALYVDNNFSHCGVDAFQLFRDKDGWKIFHLADTRRKESCTIPKEIQDKHK